jgi:hypothetical protein
MHCSAGALVEGFSGSEMIHDVCDRFHCEKASVLFSMMMYCYVRLVTSRVHRTDEQQPAPVKRTLINEWGGIRTVSSELCAEMGTVQCTMIARI